MNGIITPIQKITTDNRTAAEEAQGILLNEAADILDTLFIGFRTTERGEEMFIEGENMSDVFFATAQVASRLMPEDALSIMV